MALTPSTMLPLGTVAPDFTLPAADGTNVALASFDGSKAYLIIFMCNHCPFVKHVASELAALGKEYQAKGVAVIGVNANDVEKYPTDNLEAMAQTAAEVGYTFPYVLDESQEVAKAYKAACTPDFFFFDGSKKLAYRGQMDDSRPDKGEATGADLRAAIDAVLAGDAAPAEQKPSVGCNIKWKPGNEPSYA